MAKEIRRLTRMDSVNFLLVIQSPYHNSDDPIRLKKNTYSFSFHFPSIILLSSLWLLGPMHAFFNLNFMVKEFFMNKSKVLSVCRCRPSIKVLKNESEVGVCQVIKDFNLFSIWKVVNQLNNLKIT